ANDSASKGLKILNVKVKDSGIGIPLHMQQKVFERFFRSELPSSMVNQGSGIGLAIAKEYVRIHGGTIRLESYPGKGSCFTVSIPVKALEAPSTTIEAPAIAGNSAAIAYSNGPETVGCQAAKDRPKN